MTLLDLRSPAIEAALVRIRAELQAAFHGPPAAIDTLIGVARHRLHELARDGDLAISSVSVSAHVGIETVAIEIMAGSARDWIQHG